MFLFLFNPSELLGGPKDPRLFDVYKLLWTVEFKKTLSDMFAFKSR